MCVISEVEIDCEKCGLYKSVQELCANGGHCNKCQRLIDILNELTESSNRAKQHIAFYDRLFNITIIAISSLLITVLVFSIVAIFK